MRQRDSFALKWRCYSCGRGDRASELIEHSLLQSLALLDEIVFREHGPTRLAVFAGLVQVWLVHDRGGCKSQKAGDEMRVTTYLGLFASSQ